MEAIASRMSMMSIYWRIKRFGLRSYRPLLCLPLTRLHRASRWECVKHKLTGYLMPWWCLAMDLAFVYRPMMDLWT